MFKYLFYASMVLLPCVCRAQTPEQLEMMRSLGVENVPPAKSDVAPTGLPKVEKTALGSDKQVPSRVAVKADPNEKLVPLADMSVYAKPESQMTPEERDRRNKDALKGRITVMMKNLSIYKTISGRDVCTVDVELNNATGKTLNDLYIVYSWGENETFVRFSGVKPFTKSVFNMGAADAFCSSFYQLQSEETITSCKINGLSFEACKDRVIIF